MQVREQCKILWNVPDKFFILLMHTLHSVACMMLSCGRWSKNPRTERDHGIAYFRLMVLRHHLLLLLNIYPTARAQRCQTTYTDDGDSSLTYLSEMGALPHTRIMADSVWLHVEIPFKASPSAKCSPVSLRSSEHTGGVSKYWWVD